MLKVFLKKMAADDYQSYLSSAIAGYAEDKVKAGTWNEKEALQLATYSFNDLLPNGIESKGEYLYAIEKQASQEKIGFLWFHADNEKKPMKIFIYDFIIFEAYRNQGYGKEALSCLNSKAKEIGASEIGLHVFAHNKAALHLYEKVGFLATDISMVKKVNG